MVTTYLCPVCGYGMEDPPSDFNICPCCGTEFGYHDANTSTNTLRAAWLRGGQNGGAQPILNQMVGIRMCRFPRYYRLRDHCSNR